MTDKQEMSATRLAEIKRGLAFLWECAPAKRGFEGQAALDLLREVERLSGYVADYKFIESLPAQIDRAAFLHETPEAILAALGGMSRPASRDDAEATIRRVLDERLPSNDREPRREAAK